MQLITEFIFNSPCFRLNLEEIREFVAENLEWMTSIFCGDDETCRCAQK